MQSTLELSQTALPGSPMPFVGNGQNLMLGSARLQAHAFNAVMQYQIEALAFLKHRFEEDVKLVNDVVASDAFNDAFDVVAIFMQNAATEYATELSKVISIGSKIAAETATRVRKQAVEATEDILVATTA